MKELEKYFKHFRHFRHFRHSIEYNLNENKELIIYKLSKYKIFKKEFKLI